MDLASPVDIDWQLLARATEFYSPNYTYVEVPWIVRPETTALTYTGPRTSYSKYGDWVGSAEQALLQMWLDGKLRNTYVSACTPCFREEDSLTDLHRPVFMKVELGIAGRDNYHPMMNLCVDFFKAYAWDQRANVEIVQTDIGHDILLNKIEIGSYGVRHTSKGPWAYGTGLALPRFTQALRANGTT
jgi:aspartyl/asparaginyl-tRNA synthetase